MTGRCLPECRPPGSVMQSAERRGRMARPMEIGRCEVSAKRFRCTPEVSPRCYIAIDCRLKSIDFPSVARDDNIRCHYRGTDLASEIHNDDTKAEGHTTRGEGHGAGAVSL